ncbi:hypothetical protein M0R45_016320 [Rubus argutus]|uniref:Uncharacterized protein n=1 Tax=Rubus argutus TaxID=59490 RepID=A0AAW1XUR1_RUBAR
MGASLSVPLSVLDAGKVCGTTIVAVKFKEGIVFGADARIVGELNGYKFKKLDIDLGIHHLEMIFQMTLTNFLVISPNWVYLMAGYQKQCHDLYKELVNMAAEASKVVSVTEALGMIAAYVDRFVENLPDNTRNFGGIIGGWLETEGFEAYQFGLDKTDHQQIVSFNGIGMTSGANMSKLEAVETVMKTLLYASYLCDSTGGKLSGI